MLYLLIHLVLTTTYVVGVIIAFTSWLRIKKARLLVNNLPKITQLVNFRALLLTTMSSPICSGLPSSLLLSNHFGLNACWLMKRNLQTGIGPSAHAHKDSGWSRAWPTLRESISHPQVHFYTFLKHICLRTCSAALFHPLSQLPFFPLNKRKAFFSQIPHLTTVLWPQVHKTQKIRSRS